MTNWKLTIEGIDAVKPLYVQTTITQYLSDSNFLLMTPMLLEAQAILQADEVK